MYGGLPCEGPELEVQDCKVKECPVDCEITAWAQTGPCDKQCGTGAMPQSRQITVILGAEFLVIFVFSM